MKETILEFILNFIKDKYKEIFNIIIPIILEIILFFNDNKAYFYGALMMLLTVIFSAGSFYFYILKSKKFTNKIINYLKKISKIDIYQCKFKEHDELQEIGGSCKFTYTGKFNNETEEIECIDNY